MTAVSIPAHARFPARADSVAAARRFVGQTLREWAMDELLDDALLLVSELATNAVVHAGTPFDVTCVDLGGGARVEVYDRHAARSLPAVPAVPDATRERGRGLLVCAALTSSWGVEYSGAGKTVWCQLDLPRRAALPPVPRRTARPPEQAEQAEQAGQAERAGQAGQAERDGGGQPGVPVGVVTVDAAGLVGHWNADAQQLLGWNPAQVRGRPFADLTGPGTTLPEPGAGAWQADVDLRHRDGGTVPAFAALRSGEGGGPRVWLLAPRRYRWLLERPAAPVEPAAEPADWASFSRAELRELRLPDLLGRAVRGACDSLGGDAAFVVLADESGAEPYVAAATGLPASVGGAVPAAQHGVAGRLVREHLPAVFDDLAASESQEIALPLLAGTGMRSAVTVPLLVDGRLVGQLGVAATEPGRFANADALRLQSAADRLAQVVDSHQIAELARRHRGWLGYLAEASDLLAGTLDPRMTLSILAQLIVPRLASWCAVSTPDGHGRPVVSHVWHEDEGRIDPLRARMQAVGSGAAAEDHTTLGTLDGEPTLTVALHARGHHLGSVRMGRAAGDRFDRDVVDLAEELCRRAALVLDNALLYRSQVNASQTLQRSLLPARMPEVTGMEIGVAYEAAGEGHEVGGDFYDLFAVGGDRWRFTIGDVCGSGPEAAAVTGMARHALRILGGQGHPVQEVLGELNRAIRHEHSAAQFLTMLHGEIAHLPGGGAAITMVAAGHPLPYLLGPGRCPVTVGSHQPLLGVLDEVAYTCDTLTLPAGTALLCLTDGVLERRSGPRMLGEDDLDDLLAACAELSAPAIATTVQAAVVNYAPQPPSDDLAVLVIRAVDEQSGAPV